MVFVEIDQEISLEQDPVIDAVHIGIGVMAAYEIFDYKSSVVKSKKIIYDNKKCFCRKSIYYSGMLGY